MDTIETIKEQLQSNSNFALHERFPKSAPVRFFGPHCGGFDGLRRTLRLCGHIDQP